MITFLDSHELCRFGATRFWAERGLVHIEEDETGDYQSVSVSTILKRMRAVSEMIGNSRDSRKGFICNDIAKRWQDMLDKMVIVVQKAQEQGMPSDPTAHRDRQIRKRRTFLVPGCAEAM